MGLQDKRRFAFFHKKSHVFFAVSILSTVLFFVVCSLWKTGSIGILDYLVLGNKDEWEFADFYRHIGYGSDLSRVYETSPDACFPPLSYLFFHFLYLLNPVQAEAVDWRAFRDAPYGRLSYLFCMMLLVLLFSYAAHRVAGMTEKTGLLLSILLLSSAPFFTAIERGNPVFLTMILLLYALWWKESDNRYLREAALVLIAIAAGFKILPALYGLLYVREKRWKEAGRLLLYGILLFFVPFLLTGGREGFFSYIRLLLDSHYQADFMREWSSVRGFVYRMLSQRLPLGEGQIDRCGMVMENFFLLCSIAGVFVSKKKWMQVLWITMPVVYYMPTSQVYNAVYLCLPLLFFLGQKERERGEVVYLILFGLLFALPAWGSAGNLIHWISGLGYLLFLYAVLGEAVRWIKERRRQDER